MKNKFIPGLIVGMLCSFLAFTGIYMGTAWGKSDSAQNAVATVTPTPEANSAGSLLNSGVSQVQGQSVLDSKALLIQQLIDRYFLYDVTEEDYETAIYRALLAACNDPYSCYYTPEEYRLLEESNSGVYCGIGCVVSQDRRTMQITVVRPFKDSPAERAGLKTGDIIYKVDGENVTNMDINLVVSQMKGEEDTKVVITVYREGETDFLDFEITRAFIENETITTEQSVVDGHKLGTITITEFDEVTVDQFKDALEELTAWGMEGLVIDLRNNPGGLVDAVVEMLDPLLPEGLTVYTQYKNGLKEEYTSDAESLGLPMAVIINGQSASAAEIFAGAVQDYGVATLIGTQSFGKGIVQAVVPLEDSSAIKLTMADYYTPLGRNIHGTGITPDVVVELSDEAETEEDVQYEAAVQDVLKQMTEKE